MSIRASVETVTPKKAREWLSKNIENRPLSDRHVLRLSEAMARGEWMVNGETVKFDQAGHIKDGQHRLNAVVLFGKPVDMMIVRGIPSDSFDTIDRGKLRSLSDVFGRHGEQYRCALAAAVSWLWRWENGIMQSYGATPSPAQAMDVLTRNPGLRDSVSQVFNQSVSAYLSPSIGAFCHYIFSKKSKSGADDFFSKLATGEELKKTQGVYQLRKRLIDNRASKGKLRGNAITALTIKAWNVSRNGDSIQSLGWRVDEDFPKVK